VPTTIRPAIAETVRARGRPRARSGRENNQPIRSRGVKRIGSAADHGLYGSTVMKSAASTRKQNRARAARQSVDPLTETRLHVEASERQRAERALAHAEQRYRRLVEKLPAITYIAEGGPAGRWLFVSPQIETMLGYSPEEWRADPTLWASRIHPDDRDRVLSEEADQGMSGVVEPTEYRVVARDGRVLWVRDEAVLSPLADAEGGQVFEGLMTDVSERKRLEEELRHHAEHDALTGLLNRRRFEEELWRHVNVARRGAVLIFDIDHFKLVNDSFGHSVGDETLRAAAACLRERLHSAEALARLGGDEFAAILPDAGADEAMSAVRDMLAWFRDWRDGPPVTASAGVALFDQGSGLSADEILVRADLALYDAKEEGRNQVSLAGAERHVNLQWVERLKEALAEDRLILYGQPIVELATGETLHEELLVRLLDKAGEVIGPSSFLLAAERFGLVREIDRWVVHRALCMAAEGRKVGVNVSAQAIGDPDLVGQIQSELETTGANPANVVIEITETSAVANLDDARRFVEKMTGIGIGVALDDFGTGFSSFAYLKHLPVQWLKIDQEFIRELPLSPADQRIVRAIATIADGFGMRTVAEGVEAEGTEDLLRSYGIDCAQGHRLASPRPLGVG
jgi:diguanylate cyclase (GGDEF)-like protein/PAS domain S-box-containing protein